MSKKEGEFITEMLADNSSVTVDLVSGHDANAENITLKLTGQSYSIVHMSTHGFFEDSNVYMVTAGANTNEDVSKADVAESVVNVGDADRAETSKTVISESDFKMASLENTALVTLALCFGGKQSLVLQDSLSGFIKASLLAGADTIIAPVAPIPDLSTAIFMSEFYKRFIANYETENAEVTLQKAIMAIRKMSKAELLEKYHIEVKEEYPFEEVKHWGKWVCFSAEEMR